MPGVALVAVAMVRTLEPVPGAAMDLADNVVVTPAGAPETEIAIVELKPVCAVVVNVTGVEPGNAAVTVLALGTRVKEGAPMTSGMPSVAVCPALEPVMVSV